MEDEARELASQRVERAKRRFETAWRNRRADAAAVEHALDELDVAVGLWVNPDPPASADECGTG